ALLSALRFFVDSRGNRAADKPTFRAYFDALSGRLPTNGAVAGPANVHTRIARVPSASPGQQSWQTPPWKRRLERRRSRLDRLLFGPGRSSFVDSCCRYLAIFAAIRSRHDG